MSPLLTLLLLGKPEVRLGDQPVTGIRTAKAQALLYYLAVTKQPHPRHALAGLLWGEDPEEKAKNSLRVALANLNKLFPHHLEISRQTVAFKTDSPHQLDVERFMAKLHPLPAPDPSPDLISLEEALALYRGEFLADFYVEGALVFEEWVLAEREHWRQQALDGLQRLADGCLEQRAYPKAAAALKRLVALEPWHEEAHRQLMVAYSRMGDLNSALAQYERCRRALAEELDVAPMPETEALCARIQTARQARPHPLPRETMPCVGREVELSRIQQMLARPDCRLITIVGLGGMGKTRLALAAAQQANREQALRFLNGVVWVPLDGVASTEALPSSLVAALDVQLSGRVPPTTALLNYLHNKEVLLILDNFEHLLSGAGLLSQILATCPAVTLLVTSREPLNLAAEWRLDLEGLDYPEVDGHAEDYAAFRLFVQTASQVRPGFQLAAEQRPHVRHLCQLVGGMPLAIKLAGAWLRVMPVNRIAAEVARNLDILATQMRDVAPRQHSMRAVFDAAWDLLAAEERRVFKGISVFRGGFSEEAAAAVTGATPHLLAGLVDRGLVQLQGDGPDARYTVHELTRQYAAGRLHAQTGEAGRYQEAHCRYYATWMQRHEPGLQRATQVQTQQQMRREVDNLRDGWQFAVAQDLEACICDFMDGMARFYTMQGWQLEGIGLFQQAIDRLAGAEHQAPERARLLARLLNWQGGFYFQNGQTTPAEERLQESLRLAEQLGDTEQIASALVALCRVAERHNQHDTALALGQRALALFQQIDRPLGVASVLNILGVGYSGVQEYQRARECLESSLAILRQEQDEFGMEAPLLNLGITMLRTGEFAQAQTYLQEVLALENRIGSRFRRPNLFNNLGRLAEAVGDYEQARIYWEEGVVAGRELGNTDLAALNLNWLSRALRLLGRHAEARRAVQEAMRLYKAIGWRKVLGSCLDNLGLIHLAEGDYAAARQCHEESLAIFQEFGDQERVAYALNYLGQAILAQGERRMAHTSLVRALGLAMESGAAPLTLAILANLAAYGLAVGETNRALFLLAFVLNQPAAPHEVRSQAQTLWEAHCSTLLADVVGEIEEKARRSTFDEVASSTLDTDA